MKYRLYLILTLSVCFAACKTKKQNTVTVNTPVANTEPAIQLDTITVSAAGQKKAAVYRASNTRLNDILHTKLQVQFDWDKCWLYGQAMITVRPYFYPVKELILNAKGMEIRSVEVFLSTAAESGSKNSTANTSSTGNRVAGTSFRYQNDSLIISLGRTFSKREQYLVSVDYIAKPNELKSKGGSAAITEDKGLYFINPRGENIYKMAQIWTQGETQASSVWFPTIDSPNERMTQEIFMTVDDQFTTLSNGVLVSSVKNAEGKRTDHWKLDQPHAPYLAMMAVGRFKKVVDTPYKGKEISYYVETEYEDVAKEIFGETGEMISFFSSVLGVEYPWPKYSQIVVRDYVSGAMENTSATLHGDFIAYQTHREMRDGNKAVPVISHELFHQWFGDLVTCESWSNLPLNESFATYGEYLWEEYKRGRMAADHHLWDSRAGYISAGKEAHLIRFNYDDKEEMFDAISYNKGGQVLHMLRKAIGDSAFFGSLKFYLEKNQFRPVEIHDLRLAVEEVTGQDMNWFFDQWFLNKGRPRLLVSVSQNTQNAVELKVQQQQDLKEYPLYRLPVDVDLYTDKGVQRRRIVITGQDQTFSINPDGKLLLLNFDAERQLLADITYKKETETLIYQYGHTPLYVDRLEALQQLSPSITKKEVYEIFKKAATADTSYVLRNYALSKLEKVSEDAVGDLKGTLISAFNNANHHLTRAKALNSLNTRFGVDSDIKEMNEQALQHVSYAVCSEALEMISRHSPQVAMQKAKMFEKEGGKSILFTVATIYSNHGADAQIQYFHESIKWINGFEMMTFCSLYSKTAKRCQEASSVITAAMDLEYISKGSNKYIKFSAAKGVKDVLTVWEGKEKSVQSKLDAARLDNKPAGELEKQLKETAETREILARIYDRMQQNS